MSLTSQPADPFRAPDDPHPTPEAGEVEDPTAESARLWDHFEVRLRAVGATDEQIAAAEDSWDTFDEGWTPEIRREVVLDWDDARLVRDLIQIEREPLSDDDLLANEAAEQAKGTIPEVEAWVGDDPERAAAVLEAEGLRDGGPRVTLVAALERLIPDA